MIGFCRSKKCAARATISLLKSSKNTTFKKAAVLKRVAAFYLAGNCERIKTETAYPIAP